MNADYALLWLHLLVKPLSHGDGIILESNIAMPFMSVGLADLTGSTSDNTIQSILEITITSSIAPVSL